MAAGIILATATSMIVGLRFIEGDNSLRRIAIHEAAHVLYALADGGHCDGAKARLDGSGWARSYANSTGGNLIWALAPPLVEQARFGDATGRCLSDICYALRLAHSIAADLGDAPAVWVEKAARVVRASMKIYAPYIKTVSEAMLGRKDHMLTAGASRRLTRGMPLMPDALAASGDCVAIAAGELFRGYG
jgi:hypothetical protein